MTLKELTKLIALCRKTGVTSIKMEGIELELGPEPIKYVRKSVQEPITATFDPGPVPTPYPWSREFPEAGSDPVKIEPIPTDSLTEEELLFYSAGGNQ